MNKERRKRIEVCDEEKKKFLAEAELAKYQALTEKYASECERLRFEEKEREAEIHLAADKYHHVYRFDQEVFDHSVRNCIETLSIWHRLDPKCEVTIVFCSPGGSVIDGLSLFDFLLDFRKQGHRLTTIARGYAASMAGILMQCGDERVMGAEAWLLIHEISAGAMGKLGDIEDRTQWLRHICDRIVNIFAKRAAEKTGKSEKSIAKFIRKNWTRKDFWVSSEEALKYGFVDRIE
jgi:ATP-dependent Clp endopeptidase proteolytic subunit ClpP